MTRYLVALAAVLLFAAVGCNETTPIAPSFTEKELEEQQTLIETQAATMIERAKSGPTAPDGEMQKPVDRDNPPEETPVPEAYAPKSAESDKSE